MFAWHSSPCHEAGSGTRENDDAKCCAQETVLIWKRSFFTVTALTVIWALSPVKAFAADQACAGVDTHITDARKHEYAALVASALTTKVKPSTVSFQSFIESGAWSAVYASAPETEPGFFFFETVGGQKRFKEVWGGFAVPEDRPELEKWATALGAPENLAKCFAHTVTE